MAPITYNTIEAKARKGSKELLSLIYISKGGILNVFQEVSDIAQHRIHASGLSPLGYQMYNHGRSSVNKQTQPKIRAIWLGRFVNTRSLNEINASCIYGTHRCLFQSIG